MAILDVKQKLHNRVEEDGSQHEDHTCYQGNVLGIAITYPPPHAAITKCRDSGTEKNRVQ